MKNIYTPIEEVRGILEERRQNQDTREKVLDYLGGTLPSDCLEREMPVAILARYVAKATIEDKIFAVQAMESEMNPYWATYSSDQFTTRNPEKVQTVRPPIMWSKGQKSRSWIVKAENRSGGVGQLETIYGETASQFQQNIREIVFAREGLTGVVGNQFDMGDWYNVQALRAGYTQGPKAPFYYPALMALLTTYSVLFEDFDGGPNAKSGDLSDFKSGVVLPAIEQVERNLGLSPLIVRLNALDGMENTDLTFLDVEQQKQIQTYGTLLSISDRVEAI